VNKNIRATNLRQPLTGDLQHPRVRTLTGKEIELDIEADYKVSRIKERVEEKEGIPPVQQRLIFGGKQMYVALFYYSLLSWFVRSVLRLPVHVLQGR
jgi:hypothetical protein